MKRYKVGNVIRLNPASKGMSAAMKRHAKAGTLFTIYKVEEVDYSYVWMDDDCDDGTINIFYHIRSGRSKFFIEQEYAFPKDGIKFGKRSRMY